MCSIFYEFNISTPSELILSLNSNINKKEKLHYTKNIFMNEALGLTEKQKITESFLNFFYVVYTIILLQY